MFNTPKTLEEAKKYKYGLNIKRKYNPERCAYEVFSPNGWTSHQCSRKNGYGINGLFCKQHAKMVK